MGGPALSPALPCVGRRGAQAQSVLVLTTGRQPAPLPTITTPGVKGSTQSKQEIVQSTATNESAASGPITRHDIPSSVTRVPQRWTRVTLSGVAEAQEASPVTSQHPFLETAVTHIPCNQQSRRRSGVEMERAERKERSCESRKGGWEVKGQVQHSRQIPRLGKERSVPSLKQPQHTVAFLLVSTLCAMIFPG